MMNMPEARPPIELSGLSLAELQRMIDERRLPPVERWNPERCGDSDMVGLPFVERTVKRGLIVEVAIPPIDRKRRGRDAHEKRARTSPFDRVTLAGDDHHHLMAEAPGCAQLGIDIGSDSASGR